MAKYYVNNNAQSSGEREVHKEGVGCPYLPLIISKIDLGEHSTCQSALAKAKLYYHNVDGCKSCVPECHSR